MCTSPRLIKSVYWNHPNYKPLRSEKFSVEISKKSSGEIIFTDRGYYDDSFPRVSPITRQIRDMSHYVYVPCGNCRQCRSRKQTDILQRVQMESLDSYIFMFTLTYNKNVPTFCLPNGKVLMHADYKHIVDMFKRIRKTGYFGARKFKYLVCSEYTPLRARPHFHGLLFLKKLPSDSRLEYVTLEKLAFDTILKEWRVNVATRIAKTDSKKYNAGDRIPDTRNPKYLPLLDYHKSYRGGKLRYTYDLHYVTPNSKDGSNDVSFYVTKYLFKPGSGEKFVQACCYQALRSQTHAADLYKTHFKSKTTRSLNFGQVYNDDTYAHHSVVRPDFNAVSMHRIYEMVYKCQSNDLPLTFFDLYTGKSMPMSRYLTKLIDISTQIEFAKKSRKYIDSIESTFDSKTDDYKYNLQTRHTFVTDIFDDDQLFSSVQLDDDLPDPCPYSINDPPDPDGYIGSYEDNHNYIEPAFEDWSGDLPEEDMSVKPIYIVPYKQLKIDFS